MGSVKIGCRRLSNHNLYFYVADTGCGIDEVGRHAIFEQVCEDELQYRKIMGLGLSMHQIYCGALWEGIGVKSRKGKAPPYFTLPAGIEYKEYGKF